MELGSRHRRLALCAVDLGLDDRAPKLYRHDEVLTPRAGLARNLGAAVDDLIAALRKRLEAAGFSTHGWDPEALSADLLTLIRLASASRHTQ